MLGIDGYLFEPEDREQLFGCEGFRCAGGILRADKSAQECPPKSTWVGFESFFATTNMNNLIQLHRSEEEVSAQCDATIVQWNHTQVAANNINKRFLADKMNVTIPDPESTVIMDFQFFSADIKRTTYNPQNGVTLLGSLSGWFGFLSDGWGILSLLFIAKETFTYFFCESSIYLENLLIRYKRAHAHPGRGL